LSRQHDDNSHTGDHSHDLREKSRRRILAVFILTFGFMFVEALGGWWSGSLALLGDAGHMLTDAGALGLALLAFRLSSRPPSPARTFGMHRAEILAALANGLILLLVAGLVIREGIDRIVAPRAINAEGMMAIAVVGLGVNILGAYILIGGDRKNLNLRGALFHVAGDALGSVGAIIAGLVVMFTGWTRADPIVSFAIAGIIIVGAVKLVLDAGHIMMESTPRDIDVGEVEKAMLESPHVGEVHDLHVWTITSGFVSLSAHVVLPCDAADATVEVDGDKIIGELGDMLRERFNITHYTIQVERDPCNAEYCLTCTDNHREVNSGKG